MEKLFSFIAEHSQILSLAVALIVGYFVVRLEPFKVRDRQFAKDIDELKKHHSDLLNYVSKNLRDWSDRCAKCRREIDSATNMDKNEVTKIEGRLDLIDEKLGKHEQFYYETKSWMLSKKEFIEMVDDLRADNKAIRGEIEALKHEI